MRTNYHTHTRRCLHAFGNEEDYIRSALAAGVSILGFSDHAPFPDQDYGYRMPYNELKEYFAAVDLLTNTYSSDIVIRKGLEIEYVPQYRSYYEELLWEHKLDYLLLGEHFFLNDAGCLINITQVQDSEVCLSYAKAIADAMKTGYFQIVAHPDIFAINYFAWDKNCDAATDIILDAAATTGTILEFNANGFRRGLHDYPDGNRYMYPHMNFWNRASDSGIRVIVGSDCHEACQVWDEWMVRSLQILDGIGITPIQVLD